MAVLAWIAGAAVADGPVLDRRDGEFLLGPFPWVNHMEHVQIDSQVFVFPSIVDTAEASRLQARVVVDLADLDRKSDQLAGLLELPEDNCARQGDNLVVKDLRSDLSVVRERAIVDLRGRAQVWVCLGPFLDRFPEIDIEVSIPIRLVASGPTSIALELDSPRLGPPGSLGDSLQRLLEAAGVDASGELEKLLYQALDPGQLEVVIPDEFLTLDPKIHRARFVGAPNDLMAEVIVSIDLAALGFFEP